MSDVLQTEEATSIKYFIGGIPSDVTHKQLFDFFKTYGVVKRITIFNSDSRGGKKLYGFCFIKFKKLFVNYSLDDKSRSFIFQGRKLEIDPVIRRSNLKNSIQEKHSKRVFLQNIPKTLQKVDLFEVFSKFGRVVNCFVIDRERTRRFIDASELERGTNWKNNYGYVIFERREDATKLTNQRFVELADRTRIYVKKYSSTINRLASEEREAHHSKLPAPAPGERRSASINETHCESKAAGLISVHNLKPTAQIYYTARLPLHSFADCDNLRFNISL